MKEKSSATFFGGFKEGLKGFGSSISTIVNTVLLFIVYVIGVGLTTLFAKISGKELLTKHASKDAKTNSKTYWVDLDLQKQPIETYYRQF